MQKALELAEANEGRLRSCRGILPLVLKVKRDFRPFPNAKADDTRLHMVRVEISYHWEIDEAYWGHCKERWAAKFPKVGAYYGTKYTINYDATAKEYTISLDGLKKQL